MDKNHLICCSMYIYVDMYDALLSLFFKKNDIFKKYIDDNIPDTILIKKGVGGVENPKCYDSHITILYGIKDNSYLKQIQEICQEFDPIEITLKQISLFKTNKDFDVIKVEVAGENLFKLNKRIIEKIPYQNSYPSYTPHLTLAYVQKGKGTEFENDRTFVGKKFLFKKCAYPSTDRDTTYIPFKTDTVKEGYRSLQLGSGGYGSFYGGATAPLGAFATPNPQTTFASKYTSTPLQGNVSTYDYNSITDEDLNIVGIDKDELLQGMKYEIERMELPEKEKAKELAVKRIKENPDYYSKLENYLDDSLKEVTKNILKTINSSKVNLNEDMIFTQNDKMIKKYIDDLIQNLINKKCIYSKEVDEETGGKMNLNDWKFELSNVLFNSLKKSINMFSARNSKYNP